MDAAIELTAMQLATHDSVRSRLPGIDTHLAAVRRLATQQDFVDLRTAEAVAARLKARIGVCDSYNGEQLGVLQAALDYFLEPNDKEADFASPLGFDDDARVVEEAEAQIDRLASSRLRSEGVVEGHLVGESIRLRVKVSGGRESIV
jgi:uncharacterized membrane protein YkvA (DUF1232 family)